MADPVAQAVGLAFGGSNGLQRPRKLWRNFSRSSGVMRSQRSSMRSFIRRRILERGEPWPPQPPKRMRHSARSPSACQKVIWRQPKSGGSSQFHRCSTSSPPRKTNRTIARIASGARKIHFFLMFSSSCFLKFVVNALQSFAQMQHGIAFAREQRIHAHAGFGGHFLEAAPLQFVSDEYFTLLAGQFAEGKFQLIQKHVAEVERFRAGIGRWQQIFDPQKFAVFALERCVAEGLRLLLAEKVGDAIARDAKKPAGHVLDG